jgi:hypothetical protein
LKRVNVLLANTAADTELTIWACKKHNFAASFSRPIGLIIDQPDKKTPPERG